MQPDATVTAPIGAVAVALGFAPRTKDRSQHATASSCGSARYCDGGVRMCRSVLAPYAHPQNTPIVCCRRLLLVKPAIALPANSTPTAC